ncbi:hypothetical protein Sm713_40270 [Streptomyces sp. TS71-3]|nr:hypothetical protein Sm713_40270 [Streptomyces sp. TS71-3]
MEKIFIRRATTERGSHSGVERTRPAAASRAAVRYRVTFAVLPTKGASESVHDRRLSGAGTSLRSSSDAERSDSTLL